MVCLFWSEIIGNWSRDGCSVLQTDSGVFCACDHLTNFVLGADNKPPSSPTNNSTNVAAIVAPIIIILAVIVIVGLAALWYIR